MSLASRNNLPTVPGPYGTTQYGSSAAVTFVKFAICPAWCWLMLLIELTLPDDLQMVLDGDFRRGCSNSGRNGGVADPSATRNRNPRQRAVVQVGTMVAQMPAQAMISTTAQPAAAVTNITVQVTNKGMEFIFPAFTSCYYDPVIAEETSFTACSTCMRTNWNRRGRRCIRRHCSRRHSHTADCSGQVRDRHHCHRCQISSAHRLRD